MDPYEFSEDFEEPGKKPSSSPFKTSLQILKTSSDASAASTSGESAQQQKESLKISTEEKMPLPANSGKDEAILEVSGSSTLKLVQQEGDQKAEGGSKILEAESEASASTGGKPAALPALSLLKRLDREAETVGASPLGSPLTPDSVDNAGTDRSSEREGSPAGVKDKRPKSRRSRGGTPNTEAGKRKPSAGDVGPGSPQTVVSERRQLALLRQQAKDSEKQMSPDTSFSRDGPSTPSSTSSTTRESRSANRRDGRGETPLHVACKKGDMVSARKLIDDGADVNAADNAGWTPLHEAANHGKEDVVRLLIIHGANLSVKGVDGLTPLMDAVINGHVGIAEALLKAGADPHCVNDKGESCLDLVADEREKFQDLFLSHGSSSNKGASESAAANIRKRKREGASSMEKDGSSTKDHGTGKKESELEKTAQSNAAAPSPATTATTTAPSKKLKIVSESQYEDISEDEEESSKKDDVDDAVAVSDGAAKNTTGGGAPAVASSLPVVQGEEPSTDRADPQTSHVSSPIPEAVLVAAKTEVVAPPSTLATPPVNATLPTMPPARTLPVLKLRPPSPERTTATITMPSVLNTDTPAVAIASEKPSPAATDISISPSPSTILPSTATLVKSAADLETQSKAETPAVLPDVVKDNAGAALAGKQPDVEKSEPLTTPLEKSTEPHLFGTVPVHVPVHEALPVSPSAAETAASKAGVAVLSVESSAGAKSIKVSPLAESEKPQTTSPPTAATSVITSATATPPMASEVIQPSPVPVEISPSMEAKPVTQSSVRPLSVVSTTELTSPPIPANCSETEKNQPAEPPLPPPTHSSSTMLITESPLMTSVHPSPEAPLPPPAVVVSPPPSVPTKESPLTITAIRTLTAQTFAAPPVGSQKTDPSRKEKRLETKDKDTAALPLKLVLSGQSASPQAQNQPPLHQQERLMLTVKRSLKEPTGDEAGRTREAAVQRSEELAASSSGAAVDGAAPSGAGETAAPTRRDVQSPRASEPPSNSRKKEEKPAKPMTRAQRAQAQASTQSAGPGRRRKEKPDEKQPRGRPASKRAAADADIQSGEDAGGLDTKPKRLPARLSPKKLKTGGKDEPSSSSKMIMEPPKSPVEMMTESPTRLPFKKRMAIRNEIEEFINQRRLVEENWKKYSNNFPMKIFPKGCNDYLIMRKNYSSEAALPKKLDAPLALPPALKDFFIEQSDERAKLVRAHLIERDRLIMGAEQETMRLHQRFSRISAGITIPYSACMIISEQDSNRPFPNLPLVPSRNRTSPRDLIKWLEESDDKFDYAKKELLTRHRLEAAMLRSKQRLDWAWKASDLNLVDPSCRNPEELNNLYVPEVVVEDFTLLQDQ
ncbi:putative Ankyrin repeat domain-containing protein 12 [Hypsibius exemplaris]|uniref:Ankyrin repeat domain-containing protein 12 n=1 Tax=Hypsibius exemplaris TaxID=2072580 RepID=A0A1W0W9E1_HYPEX|nr:putative Ankyrin repeat domain-containing protein 12 [Hypsibius exemplaris]